MFMTLLGVSTLCIGGAAGTLCGEPTGPGFFTPVVTVVTLLVVFGVGLSFIIWFIRRYLRNEGRLPASLRMVIALVTVPKEAAEEEQLERRQEPKTIAEQLAGAEALFSMVGGIRAQRGPKAFFAGRTDHLSFEIVSLDGLISFYVACPQYLLQFVEQQIHAQYPRAQVEVVEDYNLFRPESTVVGTTLTFRKPYPFPIKTYRQGEVDPLNSITNALTKVDPAEGFAIQFVCRSAHPAWHTWGVRAARQLQQGKTVSEALGRRGFAGILTEIFRMFLPGKRSTPETVRRLSPMEEQLVKAFEEKASKAGLEVNVRLVASARQPARASEMLRNAVDAFSQYTLYEYGNGFKRKEPWKLVRLIHNFIYRHFDDRRKLILNTEEMASLFHFPLPSTETPNIRWLQARRAPAPVNVPTEGLVLGRNVFRGVETVIRIKRDDRRRHVYIIGKSGSGKSVLLETMAVQDIHAGEGVCVIDPHGDLVESILGKIPPEREDDVIVFHPGDLDRPVGLNMLEAATPEERDFAVQEMISIFYKLFPPEMIGPMFEHNMRNVMLTLMEDQAEPGTIAEIPRMFTDVTFQKEKVAKVRDPIVRAFWEKEMAKTSDFHKSEMLGYIVSKVGRFVENSMVRNIIGQSRSGFNLDEIMAQGKILLVNLAKGTVGEVNSSLLGLIIVSKLQMAAFRRSVRPQAERRDFYLYVDEFQNFVTDSIATILSEARKYRLNLTLAHQYLGQLVQGDDAKIRDAVFGNVGTFVAFRVGVEDAETVAKEFAPVFNAYDAINVPMFTANAKLLIDNTMSKPFSMETYPPQAGDPARAEAIRERSRQRYGRDRQVVEQEILVRSRLGQGIASQPPPVGERSL